MSSINNETMILAEKFCLDMHLATPDGSPIRGEAAHYFMELFSESEDDSNLKLIYEYEKLGLLTIKSQKKG